ncbi:hypothetical protein BSM4216_2835 [Bacillus smithii]|nr:hypothetical protein BSM4216_2835 [Bacillus smithii]
MIPCTVFILVHTGRMNGEHRLAPTFIIRDLTFIHIKPVKNVRHQAQAPKDFFGQQKTPSLS